MVYSLQFKNGMVHIMAYMGAYRDRHDCDCCDNSYRQIILSADTNPGV